MKGFYKQFICGYILQYDSFSEFKSAMGQNISESI